MIRFSGRSWGVPSHLQENPTEIVAKLCCVVAKWIKVAKFLGAKAPLHLAHVKKNKITKKFQN